MLHVCFVRSYEARGRIVSIDADEARALPGVHAVFVAGDLNPGVHEQWHSQLGPASPETPRPPLAEGEVRFVGDPVALVIAESRYIAEDASERSEEHTSELQSLMRISYAVFCLKKKSTTTNKQIDT